MRKNTKALNFNVDHEFWKEFKAYALEKEITMSKLLIRSFEALLEHEQEKRKL